MRAKPLWLWARLAMCSYFPRYLQMSMHINHVLQESARPVLQCTAHITDHPPIVLTQCVSLWLPHFPRMTGHSR